jgi:hypothetical protein
MIAAPPERGGGKKRRRRRGIEREREGKKKSGERDYGYTHNQSYEI